MPRHFIFPLLLASGIGPYLWMETGWHDALGQGGTAVLNQIDSWSSSRDTSDASSNSSGYSGSESSSSGSSYGSSSYGGSSSSSADGDSASASGYRSSKGKSKRDSSYGSDSSNTGSSSSYGSDSSRSDSSTSTAYSSSSSLSSSGSTLGTNALAPTDPGARADAAKIPSYEFSEVFRFDVTPRWIVMRWPRVTTVLAETELEGLRVPLVTGTKPDDVAGSLTYYFDKKHVIQRLTFHGFTGDDRRLVSFMQQHYGMKSIPTLSAGLYMVRWNNKPRSAMRISHLPVVRESTPHSRFEVQLEINRPRNYYGMSSDFMQILQQDYETGRW